jgi:hypothetical protein
MGGSPWRCDNDRDDDRAALFTCASGHPLRAPERVGSWSASAIMVAGLRSDSGRADVHGLHVCGRASAAAIVPSPGSLCAPRPPARSRLRAVFPSCRVSSPLSRRPDIAIGLGMLRLPVRRAPPLCLSCGRHPFAYPRLLLGTIFTFAFASRHSRPEARERDLTPLVFLFTWGYLGGFSCAGHESFFICSWPVCGGVSFSFSAGKFVFSLFSTFYISQLKRGEKNPVKNGGNYKKPEKKGSKRVGKSQL